MISEKSQSLCCWYNYVVKNAILCGGTAFLAGAGSLNLKNVKYGTLIGFDQKVLIGNSISDIIDVGYEGKMIRNSGTRRCRAWVAWRRAAGSPAAAPPPPTRSTPRCCPASWNRKQMKTIFIYTEVRYIYKPYKMFLRDVYRSSKKQSIKKLLRLASSKSKDDYV